jgi:hypothetical protein
LDHLAKSAIVVERQPTVSAWPILSINPAVIPAKTAPLQPPVEFPNTPAGPPPKKQVITGGVSAYKPMAPNNTTQRITVARQLKNPSITAVGAKLKITGQSRAGTNT